MMGMLDHGNAQALGDEMRDQARQQRRLAGAAPARQTNHLHVILRAASYWPAGALYPLSLYCHAIEQVMMKIDRPPAPRIVPNPEDPRLTERVAGTDQTGATVEINVPVERPL